MRGAVFSELDEDDSFDFVEERKISRVRRPLPWLRIMIVSGVIVTGLVRLAQKIARDEDPSGPEQVPNAVLIAPAPTWTPLVRPVVFYEIERSPVPVAFTARQHASGGREDTLTTGRFGDAGYGRVSFSLSLPSPPGRTLFIETVHHAADAGLSVVRNAPSRMMTTKFGPVEVASVTLAGPREQSCQAFRFDDPVMDFGFQGWLCGAEAMPVNDRELACFIDRIALVGGEDLSLKALFAQAETQRLPACSSPPRTTSTLTRLPGRL